MIKINELKILIGFINNTIKINNAMGKKIPLSRPNTEIKNKKIEII